jgi:hypothetical protein
MRLPALYTPNGNGPSPATRLEQGYILYFEKTPLSLPPADDLEFLRTALASRMKLKNISYHPDEDVLSGLGGEREVRERTSRILRAHNAEVQKLLAGVLPEYVGGWRVGKVNFRPIEEHGRPLGRHASNEYIHVDAFSSGATHGARVLRFFTNINPSEARVWRSSGVFADLYRDFRKPAGLGPRVGSKLDESWLDKAYTGALKASARLGIKMAEFVDSSPYDRAMRVLHNHLKDSDEFQQDVRRHIDLEFPPFSSWAVMTDGVSHACLRGQHALVNTFYIPLSSAASPDLAPFNIMRAS